MNGSAYIALIRVCVCVCISVATIRNEPLSLVYARERRRDSSMNANDAINKTHFILQVFFSSYDHFIERDVVCARFGM